MSVMGQERALAVLDFMSAIPPITDIISGKTDIGNFMSAFDPIMSALPPTTDINSAITDIADCMSAFGGKADIKSRAADVR